MTWLWDKGKIWVPGQQGLNLWPPEHQEHLALTNGNKNSWRARSFNWLRGWTGLGGTAFRFRTLKSTPFPLVCYAQCYQLLTWKLSWMHMATGFHKLDRQTLACSRYMGNGNWDILHKIQMPHAEMLWCSWELGIDQVDKSVLPLAWQGPHGSQMVWNRKWLKIKYLLHDFMTHSEGAVVSCLVCTSPDWAVWVQALAGGHCVVFLGKALYSHSASLHSGV